MINKEKLIERLCRVQLKHDKKLHTVYKLIDENTEIFGGGVDGCFVYEMYSIGLIEIVLDLMGMPLESDSFCRDHYYDVWEDVVWDSLNYDVSSDDGSGGTDNEMIKLFINIIKRDLEEVLKVTPTLSLEKN
tara:strand:+ start:3924 stop:4319 length:396 start_codon:yes stop_codon:yes gene_type:complete